MPVKRKYGETLTGGTNDVNPQTFTVVATLPTATTTTNAVFPFPVPVPRYPGGANRAIVMEILDVDWYLSPVTPSAATGDTYQITAGLTTNPSAGTTGQQIVADPRTLSVFRRQFTTLTSTAVGFFIFAPVLEENDNLTDQAGHGILVATDNIYLHVNTTVVNYGAALALTCVMNYRMKEIGLSEYIGIVTSQQ